jgi:hypothetical protein
MPPEDDDYGSISIKKEPVDDEYSADNPEDDDYISIKKEPVDDENNQYEDDVVAGPQLKHATEKAELARKNLEEYEGKNQKRKDVKELMETMETCLINHIFENKTKGTCTYRGKCLQYLTLEQLKLAVSKSITKVNPQIKFDTYTGEQFEKQKFLSQAQAFWLIYDSKGNVIGQLDALYKSIAPRSFTIVYTPFFGVKPSNAYFLTCLHCGKRLPTCCDTLPGP